MKHTSVAPGIAVALLLGVIGNVAYADSSLTRFASVTPFEGVIAFCDPPTPPINVQELPGGIIILTFVNSNNIWVTGNPFVDGRETNRVRLTIDPASPVDVARIKSEVDVAAVDGSWRVLQRLEFGPEGVAGFGIGFGRGDLHGKMILFGQSEPRPFEAVENPPCEVPEGYPGDQIIGLSLSGQIVSFSWTG